VTDKAGNALMGLKYVLPTKLDASDFVTAGSSSGSTTASSSSSGTTAGSSSSGTTSASTSFVRVDGTGKAEVLKGTGGNDLLQGLGGNDTIYGSSGNDTASGGSGDDFFFGQAGADVFVIEPGQGTDKFYDFQDGIDKVGLTGGLRFADLHLSHDPTWNYTWLHDPLGTKLLGLKGVVPAQVTALDFTTIDDGLF
jgi:Ca2+-binding RTX toxin-like protein